MAPEIGVLDYGVGNLLSVLRGFEHVGASVRLVSHPEELKDFSHLVLPGVGAFANGMQALGERQLTDALRGEVKGGKPLMAICLGMQMLLDSSEEFGLTEGLGFIAGRVVPIPQISVEGHRLKIPHIGWNGLVAAEGGGDWKTSALRSLSPGEEAYFVHSFMSVPEDPEHRLADAIYGGNRIPAVIARDNIIGCQFHPEKSGRAGLSILRDFLK